MLHLLISHHSIHTSGYSSQFQGFFPHPPPDFFIRFEQRFKIVPSKYWLSMNSRHRSCWAQRPSSWSSLSATFFQRAAACTCCELWCFTEIPKLQCAFLLDFDIGRLLFERATSFRCIMIFWIDNVNVDSNFFVCHVPCMCIRRGLLEKWRAMAGLLGLPFFYSLMVFKALLYVFTNPPKTIGFHNFPSHTRQNWSTTQLAGHSCDSTSAF